MMATRESIRREVDRMLREALRCAELIAVAFRVPGYRELFENYIRRHGEDQDQQGGST
jgi:hypothetical protein